MRSSTSSRINASGSESTSDIRTGVAPEAVRQVVVHHPDGLHVRIADRRTDKLEPSTLEGLAHSVRLLRPWRDLSQGPPPARFRSIARELPDVRIKPPELLLNREERLGIADRRCDLRAVSDDAGVG